jgi:hypothetical protein
MSAISFKVTIPPGSLLESELKNMSGRQRTHHLYLLGELGARMLPNLGGSIYQGENKGSNQFKNEEREDDSLEPVQNSETNPLDVIEHEQADKVIFDVTDLMAIS